jgi:hypothetical protein
MTEKKRGKQERYRLHREPYRRAGRGHWNEDDEEDWRQATWQEPVRQQPSEELLNEATLDNQQAPIQQPPSPPTIRP